MIRGRRALVVIAIVAWFAVLAAWVGKDPTLSETAFDPFSSYNTSPGGMSQAYSYLASRGHDALRLTGDIARERMPQDAVLFRIGSLHATQPVVIEKLEKSKTRKKEKKGPPKVTTRVLENLLSDDDEAWVRGGGRLVLAPSADLAAVRVRPQRCGEYHQVFPLEPSLPTPSVADCHALSGTGLQRFHSLMINDDGLVLARWPLGSGEVILFSLPEAFSNEYLGNGGNLALLERLAGNARTVYFDETLHGIVEEGSIFDLLVDQWRLGPALAILAAAAVAAFWRKARVNGPPDRADRDARTEGVELVQSLGQLYDRAVDRETSLRLYYQALVRAVHARTGLAGESLERAIRERTAGYDPRPSFHDISKEEFQRALQVLNRAHETVSHANTR